MAAAGAAACCRCLTNPLKKTTKNTTHHKVTMPVWEAVAILAGYLGVVHLLTLGGLHALSRKERR